MSSASNQDLPNAPFPIFTTVSSYREWRRKAYEERKSVGFVATMGALHEGHASLVKRSLAENDLTVISIFVNPAQFAPHEDLATYPRTLPNDIDVLSSLSFSSPALGSHTRKASALFLPTVSEMYPSGISQDTSSQKGTFVEVKGYGHQMEGRTRPTFFRGVATIVTKLFNVIEPTRTYFGQKDIQQALLLRRMVRDLLLAHPTPENLFIAPTARDPTTSLALSSRNAYLTPYERTQVAPTLYRALDLAKTKWEAGASKVECVNAANKFINDASARFAAPSSGNEDEKADVRLDYVEMNDPETFDVLHDEVDKRGWENGQQGRPVILSGAMYVGKTRLIDNLVLGDKGRLGIVSE
ncbi:Pantoate-beta-alanine ligase [Panus rudis PR-1116 ss-1]|nr:Pantoate-beta-alanine ligase [Panus rudis PR-1116 ss-1]